MEDEPDPLKTVKDYIVNSRDRILNGRVGISARNNVSSANCHSTESTIPAADKFIEGDGFAPNKYA